MSRLRTLLVFAALAALATALAACGSSGGSSDESPQTVLEDATFEGIENADLDLTMGIDVSGGDEAGNIDVNVSGPFQSGGGKEELPELDMTAEAKGSVGGKDVDFEGGLVLLPGKAFVSYEGTEYEVDPTTFSFVESAIKQAAAKESAGDPTEAATACQKEAAAKVKPADFVETLKNEGGEDVGGTETTKISGDLNVKGGFDALVEVFESPACASSLEAAGPLGLGKLNEARNEIEGALQGGHADIYVGDDNIVRRVAASFTIEPPGTGEKVAVELDVSFSDVNEGQDISAPENAEPLEGLFKKLGVNPLELLQGLQGGDIGGLLEELGGGSIPGGGETGSSGSGGSTRQEYLKCIQGASTPVDLQNCAKNFQ